MPPPATCSRIVVAAVLAAAGPVGAQQQEQGELFVTLHASDFTPMAVLPTEAHFEGNPITSAYCTGGLCSWSASAELPHGATFVGLELDACDDNDEVFILYGLVRQPINQATGSYLADGSTSAWGAAACRFSIAAPISPIVIDQFSNNYVVVVFIGSAICQITSVPCPDLGERFQSIRVYYRANAGGGVVEPTRRAPQVLFPP